MKQRLLSLDVFRGMTIFFMIIVNTPGSWNFVYSPLRHAKWDGCTPTDLVFPFFLFIAGVSMAVSYQKFDLKNRKDWINKVVIRGLKIIIIGLLLNWFPFFSKSIHDLRLFGVLQRIGLSFMFAGILITFVKGRSLWLLTGAILLSYWGVLLTIGHGDLTLEGNLVRSIDMALFGENHIYKGYGLPFDPEGLLSTLPSIATVLIGYICGTHILNISDHPKKLNWLILSGVLLVIAGLLWSVTGFPINKPIWSSSYVLFTAGLGMIFLAAMIWVIDFKNIKKGTYIFKTFGQNPLVTYALSGLFVKLLFMFKLNDNNLYAWIYDHVYQPLFGNYFGSLMFALSFVMFIWLFALVLDKKGIIVKV